MIQPPSYSRLVELLQPGDCLLYQPDSFFGELIALKTWHRISHVEVYDRNSLSLASRDGIGVNLFALRASGLAKVLRPPASYDHARAFRWFITVRAQKYDWLGLLCFTLAIAQGAQDRMFCSEFATRLYRAGNFEPFQ